MSVCVMEKRMQKGAVPIIGIVLFIVTLSIVTLSVILLFSIAFLHAVGKTVAKPDLAI